MLFYFIERYKRTPKMIELTMFISQIIISYAKPLIVGGGSWFIGSVIGVILQNQIESSTWYTHPAVVSALVTASFLFGMKLLDYLRDGKKAKSDKDEKDEDRNYSFSEKLQELSQQERNFLLGGLKELHQKEIQFFKSQLTIEKISDFESRMRAHRFGNELNRVHSHVYACHALLSQAGTQIPDFNLRSYDELMNGLDGEVDKFRESLEREMERAIHFTGN